MEKLNPDPTQSAFLESVARTIEAHGLLKPSERVIAAVSGGPDSMAMLVALERLGYDVVVAHCNFGLRGSESDGDERFVSDYCTARGITLRCASLDAAAYARDRRVSLEMACREMRYAWFDDLRRELGADSIAVAHNRQDRVETFFLNLMRASGEAGLRGIRYRNGAIIRPLLDQSRDDILAFLSAVGVGWRVDSTNASDDFARNRLRNRVLPTLRECFPNADNLVISTIGNLAESESLLNMLLEERTADYVDASGAVRVGLLAEREPMASAILYRLLKPHGFNRATSDAVLRSAAKSGRLFHATPERPWILDRGTLRPYDPDETLPVGVDLMQPPFATRLIAPDAFHPVRDPAVAWFDESILRGDPVFELRPWRHGDRFKPFGMAGSRLVSDLLSDSGMALDEKSRVRVLTRDGVIVWVVGLRTTRLFSVTASTRNVLEVRYSPL